MKLLACKLFRPPVARLINVVSDGCSVNHSMAKLVRQFVPGLLNSIDTAHQIERAFVHGMRKFRTGIDDLAKLQRVIRVVRKAELLSLALEGLAGKQYRALSTISKTRWSQFLHIAVVVCLKQWAPIRSLLPDVIRMQKDAELKDQWRVIKSTWDDERFLLTLAFLADLSQILAACELLNQAHEQYWHVRSESVENLLKQLNTSHLDGHWYKEVRSQTVHGKFNGVSINKMLDTGVCVLRNSIQDMKAVIIKEVQERLGTDGLQLKHLDIFNVRRWPHPSSSAFFEFGIQSIRALAQMWAVRLASFGIQKENVEQEWHGVLGEYAKQYSPDIGGHFWKHIICAKSLFPWAMLQAILIE